MKNMYVDLKSKLEMYKSTRQTVIQEKPAKGPDIHEVLNGTVSVNDMGSFYLIENRYPLTYLHGGYALGCLMDSDITPLLKACNHCGDSSYIRDYVFMDTETTGLSGGTGTVAFLIGIGFFTSDAFVLQQYFMRDYDEEPAMLKAVNEILTAYKGLVTFNGKAFDWNLLLTRFTFNRFRPALKNPVHVDLLYPSRMLWKMKLENCRLSSLEQNILDEIRIGDIPGALIPGIYFKYLEDRNALEIKKVIKHNETDIISMISLFAKINAILTNPLEETHDGLELLGAGRIFEKCADQTKAIHCYTGCSLSKNRQIKELSMKKLALLYKQTKDYTQAIEQLKKLLADSKVPNIPVMIELAKHYEHRTKEIPKALELVQKAVNACSQASYLRRAYYGDLKIRLDRLKNKCSKV